MKIGIIDYGVGNLGSITNTLNALGCSSFISANLSSLQKADGLILPGVGAAGEGMKNLKIKKLDKFIPEQIKNKKPFFGICLGMQILLDYSEEGNTVCLGVIKGSVKKMKTKMKLPQIGWNKIIIKNYESRIMKKIKKDSYFYFINSYICNPNDKSIISGITDYGEEFCSVFEKDNIFGIQFHPEKSGEVGRQMLRNFIVIASKAKQSRIPWKIAAGQVFGPRNERRILC